MFTVFNFYVHVLVLIYTLLSICLCLYLLQTVCVNVSTEIHVRWTETVIDLRSSATSSNTRDTAWTCR